MFTRSVLSLITIFISSHAFGVACLDRINPSGEFFVAKENIAREAVFGTFFQNRVKSSTVVPVAIQKGQVLSLKCDPVAGGALYFEATRPGKDGKADKARVYFLESDIPKLFGDAVSNDSKDADDQLRPLYKNYISSQPGGTSALLIVPEDQDPSVLATDLGPNHMAAKQYNYLFKVQMPMDGKTKVRIYETRMISLPTNGKPHWTLVHRACFTSESYTKKRCGWVRASSLHETGEPRLHDLCDIGSPPQTPAQARIAIEAARVAMSQQPPPKPDKPEKPLIPFLPAPKPKKEFSLDEAIGKCAIADPNERINIGKYSSTYFGILHPQVRALAEKVELPEGVTAEQFAAIDLIARSLFGEIRGCAAKPDGKKYSMGVARVMYNRAHECRPPGEFMRGSLPTQNPLMKALLSDRAFSIWNDSNGIARSDLRNHEANLKNLLCPDLEIANDPSLKAAWDDMKQIAKQMVLDQQTFADNTDDVGHVNAGGLKMPLCFYTSVGASIPGTKKVDPPSWQGQRLSSTSCTHFARKKTPYEIEAERTRAAAKAGKAAKKARKKK